MGRTQKPITPQFETEQRRLARFRRALRRSDQLVFDDLWVKTRQHLAAMAYAAHPLPVATVLLSMLMEEHKEVMRLKEEVRWLRRRLHD
jgi:hypothetical protein